MKVTLTLHTQVIEGTSTVVADRTTAIDDSAITEQDEGVQVVAASLTDEPLNLGGLDSVKHLHLEFNGACTLKLNGNSFAISPATGEVAVVIMSGVSITAALVTTGGTGVTVKRVAAQ